MGNCQGKKQAHIGAAKYFQGDNTIQEQVKNLEAEKLKIPPTVQKIVYPDVLSKKQRKTCFSNAYKEIKGV